jgi:hypothetical protein
MSLYKVSDVGGQKFAEIISNYFSFHNFHQPKDSV